MQRGTSNYARSITNQVRTADIDTVVASRCIGNNVAIVTAAIFKTVVGKRLVLENYTPIRSYVNRVRFAGNRCNISVPKLDAIDIDQTGAARCGTLAVTDADSHRFDAVEPDTCVVELAEPDPGGEQAHQGGVQVVLGDVNLDGTPEIIASTLGGSPQTAIFDLATGLPLGGNPNSFALLSQDSGKSALWDAALTELLKEEQLNSGKDESHEEEDAVAMW